LLPGWHTIDLVLKCVRSWPDGRRRRRTGDPSIPPEADATGDDALVEGQYLQEPLLAILKAIWKHVAQQCGGLEPTTYGPAQPVPLPLVPTQGSRYALRLLFQEQDITRLSSWQQALSQHLKQKQHNYQLIQVDPPLWHSGAESAPGHSTEELDLSSEELCLDFLTPFSFNKPTQGSGLPTQAWLLTESEFRRRVIERVYQVTGTRPDLSALPALEVRPWCWSYVRMVHRSKSQKGSAQPYAGCLGPLYVRGDWQAWLPWWRWLLHWGLGKETTNGMGHFLLSTCRTHFDRALADPGRYDAALRSLMEDADGADTDLLRLAADAPETARALAAEVKASTYTPAVAKGFTIPKKDGSRRLLSEPAPVDRIVGRVAHQILQEPLDRLLENTCHGYRPGRGVDTACAALMKHLRAGCTHILETDVEDFFDEMDWSILDAALHRALPVADLRTRYLLRSVARMPLNVNGKLQPRERGVLQGSALSPLLANLYLDRLDEDLAKRGHLLLRYGDDLRILGKSESDCKRALADTTELLATLRLRLSPEKTRIQEVDLGLTYLGRTFGSTLEPRVVEKALLKTPLWVMNDWAFVGLEADAIVLKRDGQKVGQYPLMRVSQLVLQGAHALSTALLMRCAAQGIPVTLCRASGEHITTQAPAGDAWLRLAWQHMQRHQALTDEERMEHARAIVAAKLTGYAEWFKIARLPPPVDLSHLLTRLKEVPSVMEVMGLEGESARQIFKRVNGQVTSDAFVSTGRVQRQKPDRWNCLLDAAYMLLFHHLNNLVRCSGLNPYLGFLHSAQNRYESLVCDLQEPFRHRVDRLVLRWLRLGMLKEDHFEQEPGGRWGFTREGRTALVKAWHQALQSSYAHEGGLTLAGKLQRQVLWLENWVTHGGSVRWD
jgi:group II intron reverse transcriptase/maturase/CRISPR-associated endonuclease Cas1